MKKVVVIDTSILCTWLQIPGKETCGPLHDQWDFTKVDKKIKSEIKAKSLLVLPIAAIIETGNHIAQASGNRMPIAQSLAGIMKQTAEGKTPWASFSVQSEMWAPEKLEELSKVWPNLAVQGIGIGDATIKDVADYYYRIGNNVEILTGDQGLKAYEPIPAKEQLIPRRRK